MKIIKKPEYYKKKCPENKYFFGGGFKFVIRSSFD